MKRHRDTVGQDIVVYLDNNIGNYFSMSSLFLQRLHLSITTGQESNTQYFKRKEVF